jgi:hypothetical protein
MNISDIDTEAPTDGDWLRNIFARQQELEDSYSPIETANGFPPPVSGDLDDYARQRFIKDGAYRLIEEISEATNCLKNKPWKTTPVLTDRDHFYEEMADAWHFFIRLNIIAGITAEDAYRLYFKKSEVNKFRQRSDY